MAINTRLEKIIACERKALKSGRAIMPAVPMYEWTGEKGQQQHWHIHRAEGTPLFQILGSRQKRASRWNSAEESIGFTMW